MQYQTELNLLSRFACCSGRIGQARECRAAVRSGQSASSGAVVHNFEAVGCQFPKYGLGDVRALFRLNPLVVQIWTTIALGIFDASWMARTTTLSGLADISPFRFRERGSRRASETRNPVNRNSISAKETTLRPLDLGNLTHFYWMALIWRKRPSRQSNGKSNPYQ